MIFLNFQRTQRTDIDSSIVQRLLVRLAVVAAIWLALSPRAPAQTVRTQEPQSGRIMGTVIDVNGNPVAGATVVLSDAEKESAPRPPGEAGESNSPSGPANDRRTVVTADNGYFEFDGVSPGVASQVSVTAEGFAQWTSEAVSLDPGQFKLLEDVQLRIATEHTTVEVSGNSAEIANEQLKLEEKQRIFGLIPNFYVAYDQSAEPLTTRLKFDLALKVSVDPVTIAGVAFISGAKQAANTPHYRQGVEGYAERFGATGTDGFTDIMIGGAILPSLLHQDPRYFYQGTGTTKSRIRHAMLSPFVSRNDNGTWGPNYSSVGGDLASSALANLYYPKWNRGAGLVFGNFAIGTAERVGASLAQEFLLGRLTHRGGHID